MQGGTANGFASWHPNLKHFALEIFSGDLREGHRQDTLGVGSFFKQTSNAPFKGERFSSSRTGHDPNKTSGRRSDAVRG
jgi:hypothetical protein